MTSIQKIPASTNVTKWVSAIVMFCCLFFLTGVNFIVFPQGNNMAVAPVNSPGKKDKDPSAPVEEKSSTNTSLTVQEEYLHEHHSIREFEGLEALLLHHIPDAEELSIVHFELISPPPKA